MKSKRYLRVSGAISCIWTKLFEDLDKKYVDRSGADVVQEMIKYLRGIDLALQYKNVSDLLPLLIRYQKYLKDLLKFIRDQNIHAAVCEIIEGNIKVENDFAKSGLVNLTALNTYVKYSANQMNNILTLNDRCRIENKHGEIIL